MHRAAGIPGWHSCSRALLLPHPYCRCLAALSFLAQQLLVPTEGLADEAQKEVLKSVAATTPKTALMEHYNTWQSSPYLSDTGRRGQDGLVLLVSDEEPMTEVRRRRLLGRGGRMQGLAMLGRQQRAALPLLAAWRSVLAAQSRCCTWCGAPQLPTQLNLCSPPRPCLLAYPLQKELLQRLPTVDNYHVASDGVWHPDKLLPRMAWQGSGVADAVTGWSNPWGSVPASSVVEGFTAQLPGEAAALQWAMPQYGSGSATAADRGNLPIAKQHQQPRWISKPGFLAFGALRSYPLLQLRHLSVALRQRTLPLGHPAVRTLVRQALYHVGPLTSGKQPALFWRTEWGSGGSAHGDLLETLHAELHDLAGGWLLWSRLAAGCCCSCCSIGSCLVRCRALVLSILHGALSSFAWVSTCSVATCAGVFELVAS